MEMADSKHSRFIPAGMTRDCLDPWNYVEIRADGAISPCCVRSPVGNVARQTLAHILHGTEIRALRYALLSGQPDDICRGCGLRGTISPTTLQSKVRGLLKSISTPNNFDTESYLEANPDVKSARQDPVDHFLRWGVWKDVPSWRRTRTNLGKRGNKADRA